MEYPMEAVEEASDQLTAAVTINLDPASSQQEREEAHNKLQDFKDSSPLCTPVGFHLCDPTNSPAIRHFGLHLLEYAIKNQWYDKQVKERIFIKERVMDMVKAPGNLQEYHVRSAAAVIISEVAKHEYPKHWRHMWKEFDKLTSISCEQAEVVVLVLFHFVEDIVSSRSINGESHSRRDSYPTLKEHDHLINILQTTLKVLTSSTEKLDKEDSTEEDKEKSLHLAQVTLDLVKNLMGWAPQTFLWRDELPVLPTLCSLLTNDKLKYLAADCLAELASRKCKAEDRKIVLRLFMPKEFGRVIAATKSALEESFSGKCYGLIKAFSTVFCGMGTTLVNLSTKAPNTNIPVIFPDFLQMCITLSEHPSFVVATTLDSMWSAMFLDENFYQRAALEKVAPRWLEITSEKLKRPPAYYNLDSSLEDLSSQCATHDFDDRQDFIDLYSRFRRETVSTLRRFTMNAPTLAYDFAEEWTRKVIAMPAETDSTASEPPLYIEWEALALAVEQIYGRYPHLTKKPPLKQCLVMLKEVLDYKSDNPVVTSAWLSVVSSMIVFVTSSTTNHLVILDKILSCAKYTNPVDMSDAALRSAKHLRRHACSLMVKMSRNHSKALISHFDMLLRSVQLVVSELGSAYKLEKVAVYESLIILSNEFRDYDKQSQCISEIMKAVEEDWQEILPALESTPDFISFIGMDKEPTDAGPLDVHGLNRASIRCCIGFFRLLLRCTYPVHRRNPCAPHILKVLPGILSLLGVLNGLWHPGASTRAYKDFVAVLDINQNEKTDILGLPTKSSDAQPSEGGGTPFERMQHFIQSIFDSASNVLGFSFEVLGKDVFGEGPGRPGLAEAFLTTTFSFLDLMPDYRIRSVIRITLRKLIAQTPPSSWDSFLIPLLTKLCPFFYMHLSSRWQPNAPPATQGLGQESPERLEMLDERLKRYLTRDYLLVIQYILFGAEPSRPVSNEEDDEPEKFVAAKPDVLSELGQKVLCTPVLSEAILLTLFNALSWGDQMSCAKASTYCLPVLRFLSVGPRLNSDQAVELFSLVLKGLQVNEDNDVPLLRLLMVFYQTQRRHFEELDEVLKEIPEVTDRMVSDTNRRVRSHGGSEHSKRDQIRLLVEPIVGKAGPPLGKTDIFMKNLPEICLRAPRRKDRDVFQTTNGEVRLASIFADVENGEAEEQPMEQENEEEPVDTNQSV